MLKFNKLVLEYIGTGEFLDGSHFNIAEATLVLKTLLVEEYSTGGYLQIENAVSEANRNAIEVQRD